MARYNIEIKKSAVKEIKNLPRKECKRILSAIESLSTNPRPRECKKLSHEEKYRIRIGSYRMLYSIEDADLVVFIVKVAHRQSVYKNK